MNTKQRATKRLAKDLQELELAMENDTILVYAQPLNDDLFHWHANICVPKDNHLHAGMIIHLSLHFTNEYPMVPPKVHLYTRVTHSHIMGSTAPFHICLDLYVYLYFCMTIVL